VHKHTFDPNMKYMHSVTFYSLPEFLIVNSYCITKNFWPGSRIWCNLHVLSGLEEAKLSWSGQLDPSVEHALQYNVKYTHSLHSNILCGTQVEQKMEVSLLHLGHSCDRPIPHLLKRHYCILPIAISPKDPPLFHLILFLTNAVTQR